MSSAEAKTSRPLSPHIQIYHWYVTMVMSIAHRLTGGALYFGALLLAWWLVALVIGRDLLIAGGWLLARLLSLPLTFRPLAIGKLSTLLQIAYAGLVLLFLAFDLSAPLVPQAAALLTALVTLLSGGAYLLLFLRALRADRRTA